MRLIDNWKSELTRLWSIRVAILGLIFWSAVGGLWVIWPVFAERIPLGIYVAGGIVLSIATAIARFLRQPGTE